MDMQTRVMKILLRRWLRAAACGGLILTSGFACATQAQHIRDKRESKAVARTATERDSQADPQRAANQISNSATVDATYDATDATAVARPANGSLYTDEARGADLLSDFKARRLGDLIFVDVVEASEAKVTSNAKRSRDSGTLGGIVGAAGAIPMPGAAVAAGVIGGLGTRKFEGKGETGRSSSLRARIAARVVEVLPNGDLRVEAVKVVKINKENERLRLCGIVRQRDVSAENAVPTTVVGELSVELNGKGVASADNAPGWLSRLFEKITPF